MWSKIDWCGHRCSVPISTRFTLVKRWTLTWSSPRKRATSWTWTVSILLDSQIEFHLSSYLFFFHCLAICHAFFFLSSPHYSTKSFFFDLPTTMSSLLLLTFLHIAPSSSWHFFLLVCSNVCFCFPSTCCAFLLRPFLFSPTVSPMMIKHFYRARAVWAGEQAVVSSLHTHDVRQRHSYIVKSVRRTVLWSERKKGASIRYYNNRE